MEHFIKEKSKTQPCTAKENYYTEMFTVIMENGKMEILLDMDNKIIMNKECTKAPLKKGKRWEKAFTLGIKGEANTMALSKME